MNCIQRRLEEIDRQLDLSPSYYYKQAVSTAPLVFCAIGLIAGIFIQDHFPVPVWNRWLLPGFCIAILILSLIIYYFGLASETLKFYILPLLTTIVFICLGAIRLASFNNAPPNDIRNMVSNKPSEPNLANVRGVIVTEPYIDGNDWRFSKFTPTDRGSSFYLELTDAEATTGSVNASGLVRVRVNEPIWDLHPGNRVQIYCLLNKFNAATNPGEFDIAKYMARNGVFVAGSVDSRQAIEVLDSVSTELFTKIKTRLRKIAVNALLGGLYPQDQSDSLLLALVLGHRANIDKETYNAFRKTGLLHFVCLSGMNFAMVIGFVWWVCKTAGLLKPGRAIVCTITAAVFLMVVPENAPALRAAVICFAFCASFIVRRKSNPFNSLALAAIVLLLIKPTGIFQPDWQLSFVSVLGILLFSKPIQNFLNEILHRFIDPGKLTRIGWTTFQFLSIVLDAFAVSAAAWFANAGILLYHFFVIQHLAPVWTVLVSPLIAIISLLGYLKLVVASFLPTVSALMGLIAKYLADLLIWIVKLLANLNISEIFIGKTNAAAILLFYALLIFAFFFPLRRPVFKKTICATATLALIILPALPWWQMTHEDNLTVTVLDVGHGQAVLTQLPGGNNILLDAGSLNRSDVGTKVVSPFLRYAGIRTIDSIIISHPDIDHINGLLEILDNCRAKVIYSDDLFFSNRKYNAPVKFLCGELTRKEIEIKPAENKITIADLTTVKFLWPDSEIREDDKISANDKSAVIMIEYAGRQILICSDIEKFAQNEILRLHPGLKADVLIMPHHGSAKTIEPAFIEKIGAAVNIASNSFSSYEKHQVIRYPPGLKCTALDGAITVRIGKNGNVTTSTFTKEKQPAY